MLSPGPGDFNARRRRFRSIVHLLLFHGVLLCACGSGASGLRPNGTVVMEDGNTSTSRGNPYTGDPHSYPQNRDNDKSDSGTLFISTGSGRSSSHTPSEVVVDADNQQGVVAEAVNLSRGGILRVQGDNSDGSRMIGGHGAGSNVTINHPPSAVDWTNANATTEMHGESEVQRISWNESSWITNVNISLIAGDHGGHGREGLDRLGLSLENITRPYSSEQPNLDSHHPVTNSTHVSTLLARGMESKSTARREVDTPMDSNGMIMFPDEPEDYEGEESVDGSPIETYFFIRAPLRNVSKAKCGPNQRFFRGRCRTYQP